MKKTLTLLALMIAVAGCKDYEQKKCDCSFEISHAKFEEANRWGDYYRDSINPKVLDIQLKVIGGEYSQAKGLYEMSMLILKVMEPYKTVLH